MRKIIAFFLGIFLAFTLGYATLHQSFLVLTDWLGPIIGKSLSTALTVVYLLFGDPFQFPVITAVWAGVAFLGGLIIRKRVGAVITMIIVFFLFLPALAVSVYGIFERLSETGVLTASGNPLEVLPPLPSRFTIATLFEAPIIGKALEAVIEIIMRSPSEGFGLSVVMPLLTPFIIDFATKPIIIAIAALVGVEVGKRIEPAFMPYLESLRTKLGGEPRFMPTYMTRIKRWIKLQTTICLLLMTALTVFIPQVGSSDEVFYSESLIGLVDTEGRGYTSYLFMDSETSIGGLEATDPAIEGLVASLIVSHEGITELLPDLLDVAEGLDIQSLAVMAPPTFMVTIYLGVSIEEAEQRADTISSAFSSSFGVTLKKLTAFEPPFFGDEGPQIPPLAFVLYQSSAELESVADEYIQQFTAHEGLADIIKGAYAKGRLTPEATQLSADGSAFVNGFFNLQPMIDYLLTDGGFPFPEGDVNLLGVIEELSSHLEGPVGFSVGISFWEHGVRVTDDGYGFNLLELLGVEESLVFTEESDFSFVVTAGLNLTGNYENFTRQNIKIFTSIFPEDLGIGEVFAPLSQMGVLTQVPPGSEVQASGLQLSISGVSFPLIVQVTKEASPLVVKSNSEIQVTVTVHNEDRAPMGDVKLGDDSTITRYPFSAELVSGSTSEYWGEISPGDSKTLAYTIKLKEAGVYCLDVARVAYTHSDKEFFESSDRLEVRVVRPNPASFTMSSLDTSWKTLSSLLDIPTGGKGSLIIVGSALLILAVLGFLEYRNYRKWIVG